MNRSFSPFLIAIVVVATALPRGFCSAQSTIDEIQRLVTMELKPFVLVEANSGNTVGRAQGVVISPQGHVLSAGHVNYLGEDVGFAETFRISLRGQEIAFPDGFVQVHTTTFSDREGAKFHEHYYDAGLIKNNGSRFFASADLAVFKAKAGSAFPAIDFFSDETPKIELGETLYLCHYNFPHQPADPTFLISPVRIVGVAETSSGLQYLGEGYYRVGSSGGALLKNGRLIGIQSAAYTVNAKDVGEIPLGLISFRMVWRDLFKEILDGSSDGADTPYQSPQADRPSGEKR